MRDTRRKQPYRHIPPTAPQNFLCPLSMEILTDPLMDHDGHNFERVAIEHWLDQGNAVCPISCKPLYREDLAPNHALRETIVLWVEKHRIGMDSSSDRTSSSAIDKNGSGQGNDSQSQITIEVDSLAQHEHNHNSSIDESSSSNSKNTNHHTVETNSITTSNRESEMMETGSLFSNKRRATSCPDVQNMMFLPQERQAIRMMRQRALERRDEERKERFAKASKAMSLVAIFILLILFGTKYARDSFLST